MECNTRILREKYNWNGLLMDGGYENEAINLKKEYITKENIVLLFKKYNIPNKVNLLSLDIDFNDFYILHELLKNYIFDILIIEYNAIHNFDEDKVVNYEASRMWDGGSSYFGASLSAFYKLCNLFNYSLVYCEKIGANAYFIHNDAIKNINNIFLNCNNLERIYKPVGYTKGNKLQNENYITYKEAIKL
jgi:hypothetical protein